MQLVSPYMVACNRYVGCLGAVLSLNHSPTHAISLLAKKLSFGDRPLLFQEFQDLSIDHTHEEVQEFG